MLVGCASDVGQSMEINAMAMKYLNDEQLTHMAKLRQGCKGSTQRNYTEKILQKVINQNKSTASTADASSFGLSPNNMTMGTRDYLQKHGLLGAGNDTFVSSREPSFFDHTLRLNTDFSMAVSAEPKVDFSVSGWQSSNDGDVSGRISQTSSPNKSPVLKRVLRPKGNYSGSSPSSEEHSPVLEDKWLPNSLRGHMSHKDGGASPVLPQRRHVTHEEYDKENARNNYAKGSGKGQCNTDSPKHYNDSVTTTSTEDHEEENLLDIATLKQLPKLL